MDQLERRLRHARPAVDEADYDTALIRRELFSEAVDRPKLGRFELLRRLGEGAMGVVYEARDSQRGELVALKTMRTSDPNALALLKREFRALAGLHHENLCTFHELHAEARGLAYFTMELVRGRDFLCYVWDAGSADAKTRQAIADFTRVRAALHQLVAGLGVLHQAGKIHRDIKPSNVLVSDAGRVTVLDFGLIGTTSQPHDSTFSGVVGTPLYMAPEQLNAEPLSAATDWYAIGTMLYHAFVGHTPYDGLSLSEMRSRKSAWPPPRPSEVCAGISDELDDLVHDLLQPNPASRPTGDEVLERLGWSQPSSRSPSRLPAMDDEGVFVGRAQELAELHELLEASRSQTVAAVVTGATGVGKGALVRHFIDGLDPQRHVILATRCHERESISHKILDGLVDALARHLRKLPPLASARLMPRHVHELAHLFPALQRVETVAKAPRPATFTQDKHELRRRAASALRELLARIADEASLVVWIDDLQWGDVDSLALIKQVLSAKEAPAGLFIGTYTGKRDDLVVSLERIVSGARANGAAIRALRIDVEPLEDADATALAHALLAPDGQGAAADVAREAAGNPLLIRRFVSYMRSTGTSVHAGSADAFAFDDMVRQQVNALSPPARELIRVVAVARSAIEQRVAIAAARIASGATAAIAELGNGSLIRTVGSRDRGYVEIDHARLAHAIIASLDRHSLNDVHARLASALLQFNSTDHQRVARHLRSTGERTQATHYLLAAADQAAQNAAFDRAVRLYRTALAFGVAEDERARTETALGDALRNAGRALEAAEAYERAERCPGLSDDERLALKRKAVQELLFSGLFDRAQGLIDEMLGELDLKLPSSRLNAIASLLANRAFLRMRGLNHVRREPAAIPKREAARADTFWMVGQGLVIVDPVRGNSFLSRNVLSSLRCGDPARVARALSFEAVSVAWAGASAKARAEHLLYVAREAAEAADDPYSRALVGLGSAVVAFFTGDPVVALREAKLVEQQFREHCVGAHWELHSCHITSTSCNMQLGGWPAYVAQCSEVLEDALACGNLYRSVGIRNHTHVAKLVADDVRGAQAEVEAMVRDWPYKGFDMQHLTVAAGPARIHLYTSDGDAAYRAMCDVWPRLSHSMMLRAKVVLVEALSLRGRAAAFAYAQGRDSDKRSAALSDARKLERAGGFGARPTALVIRASVAHADGQAQRAEALLREAERLFEAAQATSFAAMMRYQRGRILGGKAGADLTQLAERELSGQQIACIPAFVQMMTAIPAGGRTP